MKIVNKNISDIKPYENNPRINVDSVDKVANSIKEFGYRVPIIIDKNNVIVAGHTRLLAAEKLGITEIPCIVADDLTEQQINAFRLVDNKTTEFSDWDYEKLKEELYALDMDLSAIGYDTQIFLLNAAFMGVPQRRERVFFISRRKDLKFGKLSLNFNDKPILFGEISDGNGRPINKSSLLYKRWLHRRPTDKNIGSINERLTGKDSNFGTQIYHNNRVANTLVSGGAYVYYDKPCYISDMDMIHVQTFPEDYNFMGQSVQYVCGMSVPPLMMKRIAEQIYLQWFNK